MNPNLNRQLFRSNTLSILSSARYGISRVNGSKHTVAMTDTLHMAHAELTKVS